jgi:NAD(P)-dependent dehydrogenase (short-subunit alcohol dehydrogenase family)
MFGRNLRLPAQDSEGNFQGNPEVMRLLGRMAVITGAGQGLGAAIASTLAAEGAELALLGRNRAGLDTVAADLGQGPRCLVLAADLRRPDEIAAAFTAIAAATGGRIDILVNVAGVRGPVDKPLWEISDAEFDAVAEVNLKGVFLTMRAALPHMIARKSGRIINIGGTHGHRGRALRSAYSASKWGLRGLTRSAALEAGPHGITVNSISPGPVMGERFRRTIAETAAARGVAPDVVLAERAAETALRRFAEPVDVAEAVLFLASDAARNITGQDLAVDAGALA